ncbi:MAG: PA14 domain-containing protein [Planctomycetota bacterium]
MDAVVDVEAVGLASIDTVLSADAESAFNVVFEGSASMDADGLYRIQVTGTHTWRLWVNGALVIDYAHASEYEEAIAAAKHWRRLSEVVLPMKAGVAYPIRLEYVRAADMGEVPADVSLAVGSVGSAVKPMTSVSPGPAPIASMPARHAADFHRSIGLVTNKLQRFSDDEFELLKARLDELGIATVRGNFYPWVTESANLDPRYRELHESLGIGVCGVIRESFSIDDPDEMMADMAEWVARASDYLIIAEGPNEPYGKTENFNYRGHGRQHRTGNALGDGWARGTMLFMQDMHRALTADRTSVVGPDERRRPAIAAASTVSGPWRPDNVLADLADAEGVVLGDYVELNNIHKYHMAWPNARFYEHQRKVREQTPDAPWIITEMGWNSGDLDHGQVSPREKAVYTLRNHLLGFNAGSPLNYTFALYHYQPVQERTKEFGLLDRHFKPRPAFHALRRLLERTEDDAAASESGVAGELALKIETHEGVWPMQTLLKTSDGRFLLILWLETESLDDQTKVSLKLPDRMHLSEYQLANNDEPSRVEHTNELELIISGDPILIELRPDDATAK